MVVVVTSVVSEVVVSLVVPLVSGDLVVSSVVVVVTSVVPVVVASVSFEEDVVGSASGNIARHPVRARHKARGATAPDMIFLSCGIRFIYR